MENNFSMGLWHSDQDMTFQEYIRNGIKIEQSPNQSSSANFLQVTDQHNCCYPWYTWYPTTQKNSFEEVQDVILAKVKDVIDGDDLEEAKRLLELAGKLKEIKNG